MPRSQGEFFDSIADQWDSWEKPDILSRVSRVVQLAEIAPEMRVLDVGTGTGVLLPLLSQAVGEDGRVEAIDVSSGMLRVARSKGIPPNVSLLQTSLEEYRPASGHFDRVMCNAVFPHFSDSAAALAKILSLLRPGGRLVISHPIGREAVNRIHSASSSVVAEDSVPDNEKLRSLLEGAGFEGIKIIDEPEFHWAVGIKPLTPFRKS